MYGIKVIEVFQEGYEISSDTINMIYQKIPDVMEKCLKSPYGKKAIVRYKGGVMEILQMR